MKTREELLIEISAASRITRDQRLLTLFEDIKAFLESNPPPTRDVSPGASLLEPRTGSLPLREKQIRKNAYMRRYMAERRRKQKEIKLAIIGSTAENHHRDHPPGGVFGISSPSADEEAKTHQEDGET